MISVFLCSPHPDGTTDAIGRIFARNCGATVITLRNYKINPCQGCGECTRNGGCCILPPDGANDLFSIMKRSTAIAFAAPIYFYALPANFKAFIDRSQKFWSSWPQEPKSCKNAAVLLAAGRPRGEKLFSGSLLTLKWFLRPFEYEIRLEMTLPGLNDLSDLYANTQLQEKIARAGCLFAN